MAGPPSTLRTAASSTPEDPSQVSIHDSVSPTLQQLIRLQIFTPLTILLALGANLVAVFVFHPNIGEISDTFETIWTPKKSLIGGYLLLMYILQIGYCLLITMSRSPAIKEMVVGGVGLRFCIANVLQAAWSILFLLKQFFAASIILIVAAFLMLTIWLTLLRYPTSTNQPFSHPAKWLFIHVPVRMMLLFYLNLAIWQNGLIALHWFRYHGTDPQDPKHHGKWEPQHETHAWIAFGVITGLGLIDAFIVFLGKDLAWAACTIFIFVSILVKEEKPVQVVVPLILVASLQVVALIAAYTWQLYSNRKEGAIRLEDDEVEEDASIVHA